MLFLLLNSAAAIVLDHQLFAGRMSAWEWFGIGLAILAMCCIELGRTGTHADQPDSVQVRHPKE